MIRVVLLAKTPTSAEYAVVRAGEGYVPPIFTVHDLDGIWLITSMRSDVKCRELPESVRRELSESTCALGRFQIEP